MRILVTGATGFVGSHLVPALVAAGHDVRALVRDASRYDPPDGVDVVEGDVLDTASLDGAFEAIDAAYYLIHAMGEDGDFEERDRRGARNFGTAADRAGVDRVIYLSGLGDEGDDLSAHLASRREVERILATGEYDLTTLRAAIIIGPGSASFEMVRQLVGKLPVMLTPKWVRTPCQPIAITDAVAYLVGVLDAPETAGETFEIGGPDVLSYEAIMRTVGRQVGHEPLIVPVPVLSPTLSSYWVELVTDLPRSIARPLILGVKNPVVVTDDRIDRFVEIEHTPFETAVERALAGAERTKATAGEAVTG
jgi:uncharacterized protein YbjT (DUF2867 family)